MDHRGAVRVRERNCEQHYLGAGDRREQAGAADVALGVLDAWHDGLPGGIDVYQLHAELLGEISRQISRETLPLAGGGVAVGPRIIFRMADPQLSRRLYLGHSVVRRRRDRADHERRESGCGRD